MSKLGVNFLKFYFAMFAILSYIWTFPVMLAGRFSGVLIDAILGRSTEPFAFDFLDIHVRYFPEGGKKDEKASGDNE